MDIKYFIPFFTRRFTQEVNKKIYLIMKFSLLHAKLYKILVKNYKFIWCTIDWKTEKNIILGIERL